MDRRPVTARDLRRVLARGLHLVPLERMGVRPFPLLTFPLAGPAIETEHAALRHVLPVAVLPTGAVGLEDPAGRLLGDPVVQAGPLLPAVLDVGHVLFLRDLPEDLDAVLPDGEAREVPMDVEAASTS